MVNRSRASGAASPVGNPFAEWMMRRFSVLVAAPGHVRLLLTARRLLAATVLGGCLVLPALWFAGCAAGIDFGIRSFDPRTFDARAFDPLTGAMAAAGWALAMLVIALACTRSAGAGRFARRLLVIAAGPDDAAATRLVAALRMRRPTRFQVISVLPVAEAARLTPQRLRGRKVWGIIVTDAARQHLAPEQLAGCRLYGEAEFWESRLHRVDIDHSAAAPLPHAADDITALGRAGDILLALLLLLFTLPLLLLTALLVRLDSPGPALYRQQRVGLHGRPFTLLKFRSMCVNAEARGPVWAARRDPRITRVGAVIRLTRIDELPQLVNVLRGEMSLIGPRPERPHFVDQLTGVVPLYRERVRVKPGLTGWAQINYPYGASVEDARVKLSYDLYYMKYRSLRLAVVILISTVWVVLFRKGAR